MAHLASRPSVVYPASEGARFAPETLLATVACPACGIPYAIPERLNRSAQSWPGDLPNGWSICCPLGHSWHYVGRKTDAEKLKEERDRAAFLQAALDQAEASLAVQKKATATARASATRAKKRAAAALCPCCNRSFVQLRRHMATKHPDYKP